MAEAPFYSLPEMVAAGASVLLHVCCAPCSCVILERMKASNISVTVFFYNPNIHPVEEYEIRKKEVVAFCAKLGIPFVDADHDTDNWFAQVKGLEQEPERGARCDVCFAMRLARTAAYAAAHDFPLIATSLSISRLKNQEQVHRAGHNAAAAYPNVTFLDYNWRKQGGSDRGAALAKEEGFYRQNYCGCAYSLRDRKKQMEKEGLL